MASKRSKVQPLQRVAPATPVARPVDTFVQYRPQARSPNTGTALLRALSEVSPQLAEIAQSNREERVAKEKANVTEAFFSNPEEFAKNLASGKYNTLSSPAQVHAGENAGKRLAQQYGAYLNQQYTEQGLGNSTNANDFIPFQEASKQQFVSDNADLFRQAGVVQGFTGAVSTYTSGLANTHNQKASSNLIVKQEDDYKSSVTLAAESWVVNRLSDEDFSIQLKLDEEDSKFVAGLSNNRINELTVDTLVKMSEQEQRTFQERKEILNLASFVSTREGFSLTDNVDARIKLGKAYTAIDKAEEKADKDATEQLELKRTTHSRETEQLIVDALANSVDPNSLDLEDILTPKQIREDKIFNNQTSLFFATQQKFFTGEAGEVDGEDLINMRIKVLGAKTPEAAKEIILGFQKDNKLNNNPTVFATLWSDVNKIEKAKELNLGSVTSDDNYRFNYQDLLLKFNMKEDVFTGNAIVVDQLAKGKPDEQILLQNTYITKFKKEFQRMYYSDAYLQASYQEKMNMADTFYNTFMANYDKVLASKNFSNPD